LIPVKEVELATCGAITVAVSVPEPSVDAGFDEAFDRLAVLAYRVAQRVLAGAGDAENVAAEALARAQVRWRSVQDHAEAWVITVASRLAVREAQRASRRQPDVRGGSVGDDSDGVAARVDLARALRRLSRRQRQAVALRYLADLTDTEAAVAMGCSVPTLRTHCGRGLAALKEQLGEVTGWVSDQQEGQHT
jgi:RNA polymerase sigma factor (sigma-70 family)